MTANNKTSYLVSSQVPDFVRGDHPQFVKFLEAYYRFMEQDGGQSYVAKNFLRYLDVDVIDEDIRRDEANTYVHVEREDKSYHIFLQKLYDNYLKLIPDYTDADKTLILKNAKDFYRARGTEKSIKFLLNILTPKLIIPTTQTVNVLRLKSTLYNNVSTTALTTVSKYQGKTITGANTFTRATVDSVKQYYDSNTLVTEMVVVSVDGIGFENGENVFTIFTESNANSRIESSLFNYRVGLTSNSTIDGVSVLPNRWVSGNVTYSTLRDPSIYYPKNDILRASDGKWYVERTLRIQNTQLANVANTDYDTLNLFVGTQIRGNTTNTTAIVEKVNRFYESSTLVDELILSGIDGDFLNGEKLTALSQRGDETYFVSANIFNGAINTVRVTQPGTSYNVGDTVIVESDTGANAVIKVSKVSRGNISSVVVNYGGAGFRVNDSVFFSSTFGFGANAKVGLVDRSGNIHPNTYNLVSSTISLEANTAVGNTLYSNLSISITDPANSFVRNLMSTYALTNVGPVETVLIVNPGSDYLPTIGIDISANTHLRNLGALGRLEIDDPGQLYQANDKIIFTNSPGGFGYGAYANVANVNIFGEITKVHFQSLNDEVIGGVGYENTHLPIANVQSTFGFGAQIRVVTILGDGEVMSVANSSIGGVEELVILNRGDGYLTAPTLNLSSIGDGTAQAVSTIIDGIYTYPGRYLNDDGMLSSSNYLQDKDYYQNFSYVVKAKESLSGYMNQLKDSVHPAGMLPYGERLYEDMGEVEGSETEFYDMEIAYVQEPVGVISNIFVTTAGSLYSIGDPVLIQNTGGSGANAVAVVSEVITGNINNVTVAFGGAGFRQNDYITFTNTDAIARVFQVDKSETYHPNNYTIYGETIINVEANTPINNVYYSNLNIFLSDPANNALLDILPNWEYSNTGPVVVVAVLNSGNSSNLIPTADIASNTYVKSLGILGRLEIVDGGLNYATNNKIIFTSPPDGLGYGAYANVTNVAANGKITGVRFERSNPSLAQEYIGGVGYTMNTLPIATVVSGTGNGANIVVRATIGDGEILNISNSSIGGILRIEVLNGGDGYNTPPTINLTQRGDGLAEAYATVVGIEDLPS